jgi:hypothetical protein
MRIIDRVMQRASRVPQRMPHVQGVVSLHPTATQPQIRGGNGAQVNAEAYWEWLIDYVVTKKMPT